MIKQFIDKVVEELKLNVIGECSHQFEKFNSPYYNLDNNNNNNLCISSKVFYYKLFAFDNLFCCNLVLDSHLAF